MKDYKKYSSIENHYQERYLEKVRTTVPEDVLWVVTEKVHGSNFSVLFNSQGEKFYGRRNALLGKDEGFLNHQTVMSAYDEEFRRAYELVKERFPNMVSVQFFGELYGKERGIYYDDKPGFYGFDIYVTDEDSAEYLNPQDMCNIYESSGILHSVPVFTGTLSEVLEYPVNETNSTLPAMLGKEYSGKNVWEGVVLRPVKNYRDNYGSRVMIKKKSASFSEKGPVAKIAKPKKEMSEEAVKWLEALLSFNTESRIAGMIGKEGEVKKLISLVVKDIEEDIAKEPDIVKPELDDTQSKLVSGELMKAVGRLYGLYKKKSQ